VRPSATDHRTGPASYRKLGLSDARLLEVIDGLTPADLTEAWKYYAQNRDEIDQAIKDNEDALHR